MKFLPEGPMHIHETSSHLLPCEAIGYKMSTEESVSEDWLLVQWQNGTRDVVHMRAVVIPENKELKMGDPLTVTRKGEQEEATLIARARERDTLLTTVVKQEDVAGPSGVVKADEDDEDFSSSASDWVPSDDATQSCDSDAEVKIKNIKLERYKRQYSRTKVLTPSNKAHAVPVNINRKRSLQENKSSGSSTKSSPNETLVVTTKDNQIVGKKSMNLAQNKSSVVSTKNNQIIAKKNKNLTQHKSLADSTTHNQIVAKKTRNLGPRNQNKSLVVSTKHNQIVAKKSTDLAKHKSLAGSKKHNHFFSKNTENLTHNISSTGSTKLNQIVAKKTTKLGHNKSLAESTNHNRIIAKELIKLARNKSLTGSTKHKQSVAKTARYLNQNTSLADSTMHNNIVAKKIRNLNQNTSLADSTMRNQIVAMKAMNLNQNTSLADSTMQNQIIAMKTMNLNKNTSSADSTIPNQIVAMKTMTLSRNTSLVNSLMPGHTFAPNSKRNALKEISDGFQILFKMVEDLRQPMFKSVNVKSEERTQHIIPSLTPNATWHSSNSHLNDSMDEYTENVNDRTSMSDNEPFNRSDDNVLITNKYNNNNSFGAKTGHRVVREDEEWIAIGSGTTLVHRDEYMRINWKSYTIATRTLLLAVFPRKILATHSLTGKRSPAFQNKPAKMCLDPKITSDVIIEIMNKFNVRENLVRSIITTKCADECKMWKARNKKREKAYKNKENAPAV